MSQDWIRQIEDDNRSLRDEAVKTDQALKEAVRIANELVPLLDRWCGCLREEKNPQQENAL